MNWRLATDEEAGRLFVVGAMTVSGNNLTVSLRATDLSEAPPVTLALDSSAYSWLWPSELNQYVFLTDGKLLPAKIAPNGTVMIEG